jgi:hypothetical protein
VVDKDNYGRIMTSADADYYKQAELQCTTNTPLNVPGTTGFDRTKQATDSVGRIPITVTFALAPKQSGPQMNALLSFLGNGILALIVLAIVVERLLIIVPQLAQRLGAGLGASYAPQMGGGESGGLVAPGESLARDFGQGFGRSMRDNSNTWRGPTDTKEGGTNGIASTIGGIKDGIASMVSGKYRDGNLHANEETQKQAGFSWQRWISNPHDFGK